MADRIEQARRIVANGGNLESAEAQTLVDRIDALETENRDQLRLLQLRDHQKSVLENALRIFGKKLGESRALTADDLVKKAEAVPGPAEPGGGRP